MHSVWRCGSARFGGVASAGFALAVLLSLSACNTTSPETPAAVAPPPPAPVAPPPYAGSPADRSARRSTRPAGPRRTRRIRSPGGRDTRTWRGESGAYGYVAPGAVEGDCRDFTHTIYINSRPNIGKGTACKSADGWKLKV